VGNKKAYTGETRPAKTWLTDMRVFVGPKDVNRDLVRNPPKLGRKGYLMNRQTRELALLAMLAAASTILAWMREDQTFIALFVALATFALSALVKRHFGKPPRR
jgi:hypothetical protein